MKKPTACLFAVALILASPAWAQSQESCSTLRSASLQLKIEMKDLLLAYPGTHVVIGLCGGLASTQGGDSTNAAVTFAMCALPGCAIAGFSNCSSVASNWFDLVARQQDVDRRMSELNCS
jgi:hypothetical protein